VSGRTASRFALSLLVVAAVLTSAILLLGLARGSAGRGLTFTGGGFFWFVNLLLFLPVGALVASRHPGNPVGWLMCAIGLSEVGSRFTYEYAARALVIDPGSLPGGAALAWLSTFIWLPQICLLPFLVLLFPSGRLRSRRWALAGWLPVAWMIVFVVFALLLWPYRDASMLLDNESLSVPQVADLEELLFATFVPVVLGGVLVALLNLILRFRNSRGEERQQLKWVALACGIGGTNIIVAEFVLAPLGIEHPLLTLIGETLAGPGMLAITAGIGILKYGLYDIDRIINRTITYALLTAFLALVYSGLVVALQGLVGRAQQSPLVVAVSTLAAAALFRPARARIQGLIDRRFNQRRYDAVRTIDAFTARLRDEIDLDALTAHLLDVVDETMEPARISLWLKGRELSGEPVR